MAQYNIAFGRILRMIVAALTIALCLPAFAQENTPRYDVSRNWAMFAEQDVCWAATADDSAAPQIYLMVTMFKGKSSPQVSVTAEPQLPRKKGLALRIGGQRYPMKSDGRSAWPPQSADATIINWLKASDGTSSGRLTLEVPRGSDIVFSASGFKRAFETTRVTCGAATG